MDYCALGKRIKLERKKQGFTQGGLAESVGVSLNFISQIELAKSKMSVETFFNISKVLGVSMDSLLGNMVKGDGAAESGVATDMMEIMEIMTPSQRMFVLEHARGLLKL